MQMFAMAWSWFKKKEIGNFWPGCALPVRRPHKEWCHAMMDRETCFLLVMDARELLLFGLSRRIAVTRQFIFNQTGEGICAWAA